MVNEDPLQQSQGLHSRQSTPPSSIAVTSDRRNILPMQSYKHSRFFPKGIDVFPDLKSWHDSASGIGAELIGFAFRRIKANRPLCFKASRVEEIASSALKRERQPSCCNDGDGKKGRDGVLIVGFLELGFCPAQVATDVRLRGGDLLVFSELKDPADKVALAELVSPTLVIIGKIVALSVLKSAS
ncbi:unnamed protein product [Dovyalis caffra]|uniref:Uncharacterized protein n=1 Tax=Dovyalis caffra TaxID=77055 RepID=A0AAV1R829_9ROSI|nr:unnamed protein product [Dovyalis caffra]